MIFFKALSLLPPIGKPIRAGYFGDLFSVTIFMYSGHPRVFTNSGKNSNV